MGRREGERGGERREEGGERTGGRGGERESKKHSLQVQWNLRIKDTLGAEVLSSFRRLSSGGRFKPIGYL